MRLTTIAPVFSPATRAQAPPIESGPLYDRWIVRTMVCHAFRLIVLGHGPVDESRYIRQCDLVIVECMRTYREAYHRAAQALRLTQPGGLVVWSDYARSPETRAQDRALRTLARGVPLAQIAGSMLVTYRAPGLLNTPRKTRYH